MRVGVPIGLCLCLAGLIYIVASGNPVLFQSYPLQLFGGVDSYGLIAIPLFILIGEIMNGGGITRRIVDLAMAVIGSVRAGLAYVNILANMFNFKEKEYFEIEEPAAKEPVKVSF